MGRGYGVAFPGGKMGGGNINIVNVKRRWFMLTKF